MEGLTDTFKHNLALPFCAKSPHNPEQYQHHQYSDNQGPKSQISRPSLGRTQRVAMTDQQDKAFDAEDQYHKPQQSLNDTDGVAPPY
jgi:hypothetical protein